MTLRSIQCSIRSDVLKYSRTVLVVRLSALGDVAILQPVLRCWSLANPRVCFVLAAPPLLEPLFKGLSNVQFAPTNKRQSSAALFSALRVYNPDVVADMHHVNRVIGMNWLFRLHGVPVHSINKRTVKAKPSWARYNDVLVKCGLTLTNPAKSQPSLQALSSDYLVPKKASNGTLRIGVAPFAQHRGKIWPLHLMESLVERLAQYPNVEVFLYGGRGEAAVLEEWSGRIPRVASLAGGGGFAEELNHIKSLALMISMDSANMHFASCLGVPVVSIWGATHPDRGFYGWRQNPVWAVQKVMDCRPCSKYGNKACKYGDYPCLCRISVEDVLEKVRLVIPLAAEL